MERYVFERYTEILKEELVVARGCTEPIAIAYAASSAAKLLDQPIERIEVYASGNIIKNAKGVIVPSTKDLRGVRASAILGALYGNSEEYLEVLKDVTEEAVEHTRILRKTDFCKYNLKEVGDKLYIEVIVYNGSNSASCTVKHTHTNITELKLNDEIVFSNNCDDTDFNTPLQQRLCLNVRDIYTYTNEVDLDIVKNIIMPQIILNESIAKHGLEDDFGLSVGKVILNYSKKDDIIAYAKAITASGSDARMSGCNMPVMTNSGSGNQGMTASLPVIAYAKHINATEEQLIRALVLSNLTAIHIKTNIGRLSAFCGAVVAGVGSSVGLVYLMNGTYNQVEYAIKNMLANISGIFCDGAKPSCALKIATSVDAAFMSTHLALADKVVEEDTGIVSGDIEEFIKDVGDIGRRAMDETDRMILEIMTTKDRHENR